MLLIGDKNMVLTETIVDEEFIKEMNKYRAKPEGKSLLEACRDNPVLFAERMLGIKLRSWQIYSLIKAADLIEGKATYDELLLLTSRQVGKSLTDAIIALWVVVFNKRAKGLECWSPVGVISASEDQAKKLLNEIRKSMRLGDVYMARTYLDTEGKPIFGKNFFTNLIDEKQPNNTDTITFKAYNADIHKDYLLKGSLVGSFIKSYPPTSIILGNTYALCIVDEAGKNDRIADSVFTDFIGPACDAYDAPIIYTSTAWDTVGEFYNKADIDDTKENTNICRLMFTIDCVKLEAPNHYNKVMKKIKRYNEEGKIDEVQRAYYCRFTKGTRAYFSKDKVDTIFNLSLYPLQEFKGECDLGVDYGAQKISRTVLTISTMDPETKRIRRIWHKKYEVGADLDLLRDIEELFPKFNIQRIIPDDCPAGAFMNADMIRKGWNVTPMNFRSDKLKKYSAFRAALNKGLIETYPDADLKTELLAMEFTNSSTQSVIQHAPNYSDDIIDSFVMSAYYYLDTDNSTKFFYWGEEDEKED